MDLISSSVIAQKIKDLERIVNYQGTLISSLVNEQKKDKSKKDQPSQCNKEAFTITEVNSASHIPAVWQEILNIQVHYKTDPHAQPPVLRLYKSARSVASPAQWMRECIAMLIDRRVDQTRWPLLIARALDGEELRWWLSVSESYPLGRMPWDRFCQAFYQKFGK